MNDPESLSQLLQVCARKTEDFVRLLDSKHMVWLLEIEEAARKMFSSDFTAEPELMPKTPSQKRRRKKRTSIVPDENKDPSGRRISKRRSSVSWSTSVRRLSSHHVAKPLDTSIQEETGQQPKRVTRAKAQASTMCVPVAEKPLEEFSSSVPNDRLPQVKISAEERRSAEVQLSELTKSDSVAKKPALETVVPTSNAPPIPYVPPAVTAEPLAPVTPEKNGRTAAKLKIADSSTPKKQAAVIGSIDLTLESPQPIEQAAKELALELSNYSVTPTGSKSDRRSVRRSIVGRKSTSHRASLSNKYSLASKRESMTREAVRKSIRRSVSRKKASEASSSSSYKSYQSSVEVADGDITVKVGSETTEPVEEAPENTSRSLRARAFNKIAISNQPDSEPQRIATRRSLTLNAENGPDVDDQTISRRKSYKRAVDEISDDDQSSDEQVNSPPRKKTPSPPCPPSKVVKPPPHMKTFLHTVQKNQFLMMTPGSIGKSLIAKSFIKRNTPLKVDPKTEEKERQRQEALRKKEEAELQRKQKIEEGKKRKQEELKLRREERLRKVLQARERVEQLEEEKKKKMEQKFAQIDEKSEKVKEDRLAEEKAKNKMKAKKQEEVESRRRQDEELRKLKAKQQEEEERRHQELLQKKREEEEQERQKRLAEAKKMADMLAAEKEQERLRAEKERERLEKERALQVQREQERAAQEKEQQRREAEERKRKEQQEKLEQERQEKLRKEMEARKLKEEQERIAKQKQAAASAQPLNVTVDIQNSPACESYQMTPKSCKPPTMKINADDYGMDLNSDDSTDDESKPRKPIPAWASGNQLAHTMCQQYYHPIDVDKFYGIIDSPKLEDLFYKSKPRYNKRTSSAVWHSPPLNSNRQHLAVGYGLKKY